MAQAPPPYALRIAVAFGDTIMADHMLPAGRKVTIGQTESCTFILPGKPGEVRRGKQVLINKRGLRLLDGIDGRLHLGGVPHNIADLRAGGEEQVQLQPEDWGVLYLTEQPAVRLVIQRVRPERVPPMPRDRTERPVFITTFMSAIALGLLLVLAYLQYEPNRRMIDSPDVSDRMARAMFNEPPEPPEEEEPEVGPEEKEESKERKKAGGEEGKFGDPDKRGPSNVPRNPNEALMKNVPLLKELNTLNKSDVMPDLLGVGQQVNQAIGGMDEGDLQIGFGYGGMGTKGTGKGGGGEGVGTIHGTGDVHTGGAGTETRKRTVKGTKGPKEKKVSVRTGRATVKGQLSKELIDREVRRHKAQITFCYNKQLVRFPKLSGKVVLRWIIDMSGAVKGAKVKSTSLKNKDAESCMVRALKSWRFPKPVGGVVQVDYPFIFGTK